MKMRLRYFAPVALAAMPLGGVQAQESGAFAPYAGTENTAHLPGGRTLHLVCMGEGSPTVILTAGGTGWSISWANVQPAVAETTRVCSWDPASLGLSSASTEPQNSDNMTSDLEAALKAAGIDGPYVMVGHSLGAYPSLLVADRQPSSVVGMVLVDPSVPDQAAIFERVTPAQTAWLAARPDPLLASIEKCVADLHAGLRPGDPDPDACRRPPQFPSNWPLELVSALNEKYSEFSPEALAAVFETFASHLRSTDEDTRIAVNPARNYGDMPLIVLTASKFGAPPDYSPAAIAEIPAFQAEWRRGHDAYAALSTRGVNRVVPDSSHDMLDENPQVVIDAIDEVVHMVRSAAYIIPRP